MDTDPPPLIKPSNSDAAKRSLVDDVKHLASDGRTLLEAELAYQKSRAAVAGAAIKGIAGWAALALALVFFALMALVVGLLLGIAELVGIWVATSVTVLLVLLVAGLSGLAASKRWKRMAAALGDDAKADNSP